MPIFESLPKLLDCCCCISLKAGSIVISLLGMASLFHTITVISITMCPDNTDLIPTFAKRIGQVFAFFGVLLFFASVQFFIGLIIDNGFTATAFLYSLLLYLLAALIFLLYMVFSLITYISCEFNYTMVSVIITCLVAFYSMIVVRSQRDEMSD